MNIVVQPTKNEAERAFAAHFDAIASSLPGADLAWMARLRTDAMAAFETGGLPHRRLEAWKFTDLRSRIDQVFDPASDGAEAISESDIYDVLGRGFDELYCYRVVVADGVFRPELSHLDGLEDRIEVLSLRDVLADGDGAEWLRGQLAKAVAGEDDTVVALNTAFMSDGVVVRVADGAVIERPLHIALVTGSTEPETVTVRNVVEVGRGARLTLLETYSTRRSPDILRNSATQMTVHDGAEVHHIKLQNHGMRAVDLATWMVELGASAIYRACQFTIGSALSRNQIYLRFNGAGSVANLAAASMLWDEQHSDTTINVDHAAPGCESRELFKCVLDDRARGVFQGKVTVRQIAQKTDGKQMAQALMLGEHAEFDSKPELEIFADDVICGHGSTSGRLDEDMLFYLRARGIGEDVASALLVQAFIGEALGAVENEEVREALRLMAAAWLSHSRA